MENKEEKRQITVVVAVIRDDERRILLQKRLDPLIPGAHEKWELPGGKIEFGEEAEVALCREVKEEIGCEITPIRMLPSVRSTVWERSDGKTQHVLVVCYEAKLKKGVPKPIDKKVSEVAWHTKEETEDMDVLANVKHFINIL